MTRFVPEFFTVWCLHFFFSTLKIKFNWLVSFFLVEKCFENNCQKKIRKTSREASTFLRAIWLIIHNNVKIAKVSAISTKTSIKFDVISLQVLNHCYPKTTTAKKKGRLINNRTITRKTKTVHQRFVGGALGAAAPGLE